MSSIRLRGLSWGAVALGLSLTAACGDEKAEEVYERQTAPGVVFGSVKTRELSPAVDGQDFTALVSGSTTFALELFQSQLLAHPDENVGLGPYSIYQAMAMLYAGAGGDTATAMREVLHFDVEPEAFHRTLNGLDLEIQSRNADVTLLNANQVWAREGVSPKADYLDVMTRDYGAPLAMLDFVGDAEGSRKIINDWVSDVTQAHIPELFPQGTITPNTLLVLTNAMFMDAPWKYPFNPEFTSKSEFTLQDGTTVEMDRMSYDDFLPTAYSPDWQAVEIPYRGDELAMVVVLPNDLDQFAAALSLDVLDGIVGSLRDGGIHLGMPKFTFKYHTSLVEPMTELGLGVLFGSPDLSAMGLNGAAVDAIEHEAFIEVDEEGTRAAAATGVAIAESHGPSINVDRPFFYFIIDKPTRSVLFLGRVLDPTK